MNVQVVVSDTTTNERTNERTSQRAASTLARCTRTNSNRPRLRLGRGSASFFPLCPPSPALLFCIRPDFFFQLRVSGTPSNHWDRGIVGKWKKDRGVTHRTADSLSCNSSVKPITFPPPTYTYTLELELRTRDQRNRRGMA